MDTLEKEHWTETITPSRGIFDLRLGELWRYRDLILLFVRRDFIATYKQTILGPLWFFIQPIFTTLVFTLVFGKIGKMGPEGVPVFLYYLSGIILWTYFSDCFLKTSNTFIDNQNLFGKVYFPRLTVPLSIVISNLIKFGIQMVLFLVLWTIQYSKGLVHAQISILLFPVLLILMAVLGMGFGLIISALTTKYRDLRYLVQFGVQLLMYLTPGIIMRYESIQRQFPKFVWIADINPLFPIVESFKHGWLSAGTLQLVPLLLSALASTLILLAGIAIFNRTERSFMDTI